MKKLLLVCGLMLGVASPGYAGSIVINFDNTTPYTTTALTGFTTTGDDMAGMLLTATIAGSGDTATWTSLGGGCGSATGTGWSLSECGDTFSGTWSLASTASITSLFIDAGAGDAVFDVLSGIAGTAGSANGRPFTVLLGGDLYDIVATYSGPVGLTGFPPVGDLYRFLRLDFTNQAFVGALTFGQDTDSINTPGDITQVPEPATALLLGIGLVGAGLRRFRRART